ncbi:MAG: acetolactate synthase small subunit [bacterium]
MRHLLSVLVRNHAGVLSHVAGLFTRRSYNIESLVAGETEDPNIARITIVVSGDEWVLEQVTKQLRKLIDVIKVTDLKFDKSIRRELALITVMTTPKTRREVIEIAQVFKAHIVDMSEETITVELSGEERIINNIVNLFMPYGINEMARTGIIALGIKSLDNT